MEFFSGMIVGSIMTFASLFCWKFYQKSERKDEVIADSLGKEFEEKITLKEKGK